MRRRKVRGDITNGFSAGFAKLSASLRFNQNGYTNATFLSLLVKLVTVPAEIL